MDYEEHYKKRFTRSLSLLLWHMSDTDELHRLKNDEYQILEGVENQDGALTEYRRTSPRVTGRPR